VTIMMKILNYNNMNDMTKIRIQNSRCQVQVLTVIFLINQTLNICVINLMMIYLNLFMRHKYLIGKEMEESLIDIISYTKSGVEFKV